MNTIVTQALALGLPVVTTRHSGLPEQVLDGHNGYVVDEGDVSALAERILYLDRHRELLQTFSINGREHVRRRYDSDTWLNRQLALYRNIASKGRCGTFADPSR